MGPKILTAEEASALVSKLDEAFRRFDALREKSRQIKVKMTALEVIWGERVADASCPDHGEYAHHLEGLSRVNHEFAETAGSIESLGGVVKGVDAGLVDFFGVKEGRLVSLCWQRGEEAITHWHHVDDGFAGRQPLTVSAA